MRRKPTDSGPGLLVLAVLLVAALVAAGVSEDPSAPDSPTAMAAPDQSEQTVMGPAASALARELVRVQAHVQRLSELEQEIDDALAATHAQARVDADEIAGLAGELAELEAGTPSDDLLPRAVDALRRAHPELRRALDELNAPTSVPSLAPPSDGKLLAVPGLEEQYRALADLQAESLRSETTVRARESELRWLYVEQAGARVAAANRIRLLAIARLSEAAQRRLLGFTREGVSQLGLELDQLGLETRLLAATRQHDLADALADATDDVFTIGTITYTFLRLALVLLAAGWLRRHWRRLLTETRATLYRSASVRWSRRIERLLAAITVVAPWGLVLVTLAAVDWALGEAAGWLAIRLAMTVAVLYAVYRLGIDVFVAVLVAVARRYRLAMAPDRHRQVISSVRTFMRVLMTIIAVLSFARAFMHRGALYGLVSDAADLALAVTLLLILIGWRDVMAETFLSIHPKGILARVVRASRHRWYGVLVAPASFVLLAARATAVVSREFALGFEQTRKALAFLFRRKIERQAELQGYASGEIEQLPDTVRSAFEGEAPPDPTSAVDLFPGLDRLKKALGAWSERETGGSFLLIGERGSGKTTWLEQIPADVAPITRLTLDRRTLDPDSLAAVLGQALAPASNRPDLAQLAAELNGGPRRIVVLDMAQRLFLARVGGYDGFAAFAQLVQQTRRRVFWIAAMNAHAWLRLAAVRSDVAVFRDRVPLGPWSEDNIRRLLKVRCTACGARFNYSDLVIDRLEGVSHEARLVQSEEGYTRLLWDYSDGNPREALHFFLRSLQVESDGSLRVRLFRAPDTARLESIGEPALFALAAIVAHENLSLADLSTVTRYPADECRILADRLVDLGVTTDVDGGLRVATYWHRAVVRLLRRRNLLPD